MNNLNNFNKLKIAYINNINLENIPGWQTSTTKDPLLGQIFIDNIDEYKISIDTLKNIENLSGDLSLMSAGIDLAAEVAPLLLAFAISGVELLECVPDLSTLRCHGFKC